MSRKHFLVMLSLSTVFASAAHAQPGKYADCKAIEPSKRSANCVNYMKVIEQNRRDALAGKPSRSSNKRNKTAAIEQINIEGEVPKQPVVQAPAPAPVIISTSAQAGPAIIQAAPAPLAPQQAPDVKVNVVVNNEKKESAPASLNLQTPQDTKLEGPKFLKEVPAVVKEDDQSLQAPAAPAPIQLEEVVLKVEEQPAPVAAPVPAAGEVAQSVADVKVEEVGSLQLKKPKLLEAAEKVEEQAAQIASSNDDVKIDEVPEVKLKSPLEKAEEKRAAELAAEKAEAECKVQSEQIATLTKAVENMMGENQKIMNAMTQMSQTFMSAMISLMSRPLDLGNGPRNYEYTSPQAPNIWIVPGAAQVPSFYSQQPQGQYSLMPAQAQPQIAPDGYNGWNMAPNSAYQFNPNAGALGRAPGAFNFSA